MASCESLMSRDVSSLLSPEFSCALINRDPSWFNETWLGRIKEESGANWRLKVICETAGYDRIPFSNLVFWGVFFLLLSLISFFIFQVSNLKKILKSMLEYYHDVRRFYNFLPTLPLLVHF